MPTLLEVKFVLFASMTKIKEIRDPSNVDRSTGDSDQKKSYSLWKISRCTIG